MRMVRHRRSPGVKHRGDGDASAQVLGIGRDGDHGLGRGCKQDVVDRRLVLIGDGRNGRRQREHHMEVRNRKQVGLPRGEPFRRGGALTLRAMPVAAAVVGNDRVGAVFAARDMAAERRRAAARDGRHHLQLVEADVPGIGSAPSEAVVAENIRDLQRWTGHGRRPLRPRLDFPAPPWLLARLR